MNSSLLNFNTQFDTLTACKNMRNMVRNMSMNHRTSNSSTNNNRSNIDIDIAENQRPQKKLRPEPVSTIDAVLILTEIGITNYHLGFHNKAEQFFSQALCRVDRTFVIDPMHPYPMPSNSNSHSYTNGNGISTSNSMNVNVNVNINVNRNVNVNRNRNVNTTKSALALGGTSTSSTLSTSSSLMKVSKCQDFEQPSSSSSSSNPMADDRSCSSTSTSSSSATTSSGSATTSSSIPPSRRGDDNCSSSSNNNNSYHHHRAIHTKDKPTNRVEYDEGMRVYESPMALNDISNPDLIASTLYYNIGQTYTRQKLYEDAMTWFQRSIALCNHANDSNSDNDNDNDSNINNSKHGRRISLLIIKTLHCLGYCNHRLGNDEKATTYYEDALSLVSASLSSSNSSNDNDNDKLGASGSVHLAASLNCVGVLHFNSQSSNNTKLAMKMFCESLNIYRTMTDVNSNNNINNINHTENHRSNCIAIATVFNNIGRVYYLQSKFQESLDVYEESLRIRREILGSDSVDVAATVYNIGQTCHQVGRLDESLDYYKEFLRIATSGAMPIDSASRDMALVFKGIAEIYQEKSDLKMALYYFSRALELQKSFDTTTSTSSSTININIYSTDVATTLNKIGNICYEMKNFTTAMNHYKKGLEIERRVLPSNHPHTIITLVNIAHIHKQLGEHEHALKAYMAACKMQMTVFGRESLSVAETLSSIGLMQYHVRDYESSFESYQEALRIRRHSYGTDEHLDVASTLNSIGLVLFKQDFFDLAKKCFGESLRIRSKILGRDHRDVAILWYNIATIHFETGEDDTAVEMYKETLRVEKKALGDDHPDVILTLQHLGQVHQQMGQIDEALRYFNEALDVEVKNLKKRELGTDSSSNSSNSSNNNNNNSSNNNKSGSMARLLNLLGNVYLQMGKAEEMMKCYIEASRIYEANQRPGETLVIAGYNFYGLSKTNPPCAGAA